MFIPQTPDEFFALVEERQQEKSAQEAVHKERQEQVQREAEAAIREVAATLIPAFLVDDLHFSWEHEEDGECCAEIQQEKISGIRIHFRQIDNGWVAGKTYDKAAQTYPHPYQYLVGGTKPYWADIVGELDFMDVWVIAQIAPGSAYQHN